MTALPKYRKKSKKKKKKKKRAIARRQLPSMEAKALRAEVWERLQRLSARETQKAGSRRAAATALGITEHALRRIDNGDRVRTRAGHPEHDVPNICLHVLIDLCAGLGLKHLSKLFLDPAKTRKSATASRVARQSKALRRSTSPAG